MTVNAFVGLYEHYMGNGVQNEWPIPFPFLHSNDVGASLVAPTREKIPLDPSTYVVQRFSERDGGALYYTVPDGYQLTLYLNQPYTQDVDLRNNGLLDAEVLENSLDKLTLLCAQNADELKRAIRVDITASITPEELQESIFSAKDVAVACREEIESNIDRMHIWAEQSQEAMEKAENYADKVVADIDALEDTIIAFGDMQVARVKEEGGIQVGLAESEADRAEQALPEHSLADAGKIPRVQPDGSIKFDYVTDTPVGFEALWPSTVIPEGWLDESQDQGLLLRSAYAGLWEFAKNSGNILADNEWIAQKEAQGTVGAFSLGDGATTFRIPLLRKIFPRASDPVSGLEVGQWQGDAIRNIKGDAPSIHANSIVFNSSPFHVTANLNKPLFGQTNTAALVEFDASRVVPTADENRPVTVVRIPIIKAFHAVVNTENLDWAELAGSLSNKLDTTRYEREGNLRIAGVAYISASTQILYSSGNILSCERAGMVGAVKVIFKTPMADSNYVVLATSTTLDSAYTYFSREVDAPGFLRTVDNIYIQTMNNSMVGLWGGFSVIVLHKD